MFSCQGKHQIVESPNKCKCCAGTPQNPLIVNLECKPANPRIQIASLRASPTASRKADMIFLGQLQRFAEIFVWNDLLVTCKWFNCNSCFCTMFLTQQLHVGIWGSWYGMATEDIFWHYRSLHGLITLGSNRGGNGISQREIPRNVGAEAALPHDSHKKTLEVVYVCIVCVRILRKKNSPNPPVMSSIGIQRPVCLGQSS